MTEGEEGIKDDQKNFNHKRLIDSITSTNRGVRGFSLGTLESEVCGSHLVNEVSLPEWSLDR